MKRFFLSLSLGLLATQPLFAQEAIPGNPTTPAASGRLELMPSPTPQLTPEPLPLIPEAPEPTRKPKGSAITEPAKEKKSKTEIAADEMQERIRFRQAKTKVTQDPVMQEEWNRAHRTRTDFERREALKAYYTKLYSRMLKLDPSIKARVAVEQERSLHKLVQTRVAGTEAPEIDDREEFR